MTRHKGYLANVQYDSEARILHGEVAGLRDVITFQADSVAGIERAFRESVDDYLAFCRQRREKHEKPHSGQFLVRAPSDLHRHLTAIAQATGKSLNTVVVDYLKAQVERALSHAPSARRARRRKSA